AGCSPRCGWLIPTARSSVPWLRELWWPMSRGTWRRPDEYGPAYRVGRQGGPRLRTRTAPRMGAVASGRTRTETYAHRAAGPHPARTPARGLRAGEKAAGRLLRADAPARRHRCLHARDRRSRDAVPAGLDDRIGGARHARADAGATRARHGPGPGRAAVTGRYAHRSDGSGTAHAHLRRHLDEPHDHLPHAYPGHETPSCPAPGRLVRTPSRAAGLRLSGEGAAGTVRFLRGLVALEAGGSGRTGQVNGIGGPEHPWRVARAGQGTPGTQTALPRGVSSRASRSQRGSWLCRSDCARSPSNP